MRMTHEHLQADSPNPFPWLRGVERQVPPGKYLLVDGAAPTIRFDARNLLDRPAENRVLASMPGIHHHGVYAASAAKKEPVISFLYHKLSSDGQPETTERLIIFEGIGYGEHSAHKGQPPTWYLVGPQIGTITSGTAPDFEPSDSYLDSKHFSIACITGGPLGEAILANPVG
ncbi:MAG: hypothetical protein JWM81_655 [Candidatus Saccharibacteria bacterium]|nr:hypothetical protein [Candidatus Saccharibacteria bacterium]